MNDKDHSVAAVSEMPGGRGRCGNKSLTTETKDAFVNTMNGLVHLIRSLLAADHHYVLPGHFQTDRLEAEFGIYR